MSILKIWNFMNSKKSQIYQKHEKSMFFTKMNVKNCENGWGFGFIWPKCPL